MSQSTFEAMVLRELDDHKLMMQRFMDKNDEAHEKIADQLGRLKVSNAQLRLKSSLWESLSAAIVSAIAFAVSHFGNK